MIKALGLRRLGLRINGLSLVALAVLAWPSVVRAVVIDYNSPGDLAGNFALNSGPGGLRFTEAASGGLGGSRAVDIINAVDADNTTAVYSPSSFDLSGPGRSVTVSQFVLKRDGQLTNTPLVELGVLSDPNERMDNDAVTNSYAALVLFPISPNVASDVKLQFERRVEGGTRLRTDAGITATLASSHWYLFTATFTYDTSTSLLFSGSLEDWGTSGSSLVSTVFTAAPTSIAISGTSQVNGDANVWAGYRGYQEGGADLYDNFSAVPEPAAVSFLCLAALMIRRSRLPQRRSL